MQINMLLFDRSRKPFDKSVIPLGALAIHTDVYVVVLEVPGKGQRSELATLVGVHDLRFAILLNCLFERVQAKAGVHRNRNPMRQNTPRVPVHHHREIDKPARHRDIGDIHRPDLFGAGNRQVPEQIRIYPVLWVSFRGPGLAVQGLNAHLPHQGGHLLTADLETLAIEQISQHASAGEG